MSQFLLIDPQSTRRQGLASSLRREGFEVTALEAPPAARGNALREYDLVLMALGAETAEHVRTLHRLDPLVPMVAYSSRRPDSAVAQALGRERVYDCLEINGASFSDVVPRLRQAVRRYEVRRETSSVAPEILGNSDKMHQVRRYIERAAASDANALLVGESGTGKELVARAIHQHSKRAGGPFIAINCSAIPDTLLESELFGHEKGAFTGAVERTKGRFAQADGGTLFFDEIGEMPVTVQAKLLRVLQPPPGEAETVREFMRVGEDKSSRADVRLVFATNRNLPGQVAAGRFRDDLFQRIHVLRVQVPPLRERREDIPLLAEHFLEKFSCLEGLEDLTLDPVVREVLCCYEFPLNVRELEGIIRSVVIMKEAGSTVVLGDLPPEVYGAGTASAPNAQPPVQRTLDEVVREHVHRVLEFTGGNKSRAAKILEISRPSLDRRLKRG